MNAEDYMSSAEAGSMVKKYIAGELSNAERHALEKAALNDPFLADALEGFEEINPTSIDSLEEKFEVNASQGSGFTGKLFLGIGLAAAIGIATFLWTDAEVENVLVENSVEESSDILESEDAENKEVSEVEIELKKNKEIIDRIVKEEEVLLTETVELPEEKFEFEEEELEAIPFEEIEPIEKIESSKVDTEPTKKSQAKMIRASNMDLDYFYHLKVVDYGDIYRKSIKIDRNISNGTPAFMEQQETDNGVSIDFDESVWIDYMDYLEPTMRLVSKGKNKVALGNFDKIFENFPDDANAQFYSGLCNFYLKRYKTAIEHFDAVKENTINTFHEEADWHRLLSYKASGQKALFNMLREDIIKLGGFYSERAEGLEF